MPKEDPDIENAYEMLVTAANDVRAAAYSYAQNSSKQLSREREADRRWRRSINAAEQARIKAYAEKGKKAPRLKGKHRG